MARAIVIPVDGAIVEVDLDGRLKQLQELVGGYIEAVKLPHFLTDGAPATGFVNEEGKTHADLPYNSRATSLLVCGVGLAFGDYIAGPLVLCGLNPDTGDTADCPEAVSRCVCEVL